MPIKRAASLGIAVVGSSVRGVCRAERDKHTHPSPLPRQIPMNQRAALVIRAQFGYNSRNCDEIYSDCMCPGSGFGHHWHGARLLRQPGGWSTGAAHTLPCQLHPAGRQSDSPSPARIGDPGGWPSGLWPTTGARGTPAPPDRPGGAPAGCEAADPSPTKHLNNPHQWLVETEPMRRSGALDPLLQPRAFFRPQDPDAAQQFLILQTGNYAYQIKL
jgi:hypothetical protein